MPVIRVYQTATPQILIPLATASRTVFRFYAEDPQNNNAQINNNLGVTSAIVTIYPFEAAAIDLPLTKQANGDFILFLNASQLTLDAGNYDYSLFIDGDAVPFISGILSVGAVIQQAQYIGILNASRNAVKVNSDILENPQFADSASVAFAVTQAGGVSTIKANASGAATITEYPTAALGTLTWAGSVDPSGTIVKQYRAYQIGKQVTMYFKITASVAGTAVTDLTFALPAALPAPAVFGAPAVNDIITAGSGSFSEDGPNSPATYLSARLQTNLSGGFEIHCQQSYVALAVTECVGQVSYLTA